ncbi:MAG: AMP-binding protein, partial [Dehalococcoidales bacterium]|nr:AMP-binding protein [Dehalococcoidales bacterium]
MKDQKKVVIASGEKKECTSLAKSLTESGYEVVTATSGDEALRAMQKGAAVAVLDTALPGKDGFAVLEEAKKSCPSVKCILTTASPSVEMICRGIRAGAAYFLVKPYQPDEVDAAIYYALTGKDKALVTAQEKKAAAKKAAGEEILGQISDKEIATMMAESRVFNPTKEFVEKAAIRSMAEYKSLYAWSVKDPEGFWGQLAEQLHWYKKWEKFREYDFKDKPEVRHFIGGKINVSYNCLDRHLTTWRKNKAALVWQGEPDSEVKTYTYQQLYYEVCKFANVLKKLGVKKGDTVSIYLPMIPELAIAMLACARIGAIHSVVFGGFSAESLRDRINDCGSKILITADGYYRSGRIVQSK